ncbi:hypothetical protein GF108_09200 [Phyllobacterium sp. SYP-B3895]|uniref:hypothetical protein n=1 Tax=Phyllobacterium sp. SYP-B3895 TaxID=2663240 RepID=UPI0012995B18|nr:hypothetical protein [Phyllobacterium sp. SYP-B3895]MRG55758.1 hypothetical protein [Phyllobacterium sp. SYP-B3895]
MKRFAAIFALITALCIGWVPVFAAPGRLAVEIGTQHHGVETPAAPHLDQQRMCDGQNHCAQDPAPHLAACAACIGVPATALMVVVAAKPRIVIPRDRQLPLVNGIPAPLPRPPKL